MAATIKHPPLTAEQRAMVEANLGLVGWTMNRYFRRAPAEREADMHQDGVIGLMTAVRKFDPERGLQFSTMATNWIRAAIQKGDGTFQGKNYRRWQAGDGPLPPNPLSLDAEMPAFFGEYSLDEVLPDRTVDVDEQAVGQLAWDEIEAALTRHCIDRIDLALTGLLMVADGRSDISIIRAVAASWGAAESTVGVRLRRLRLAAAIELGLDRDVDHGTTRGYQQGCRCQPCLTAMSRQKNRKRAEAAA